MSGDIWLGSQLGVGTTAHFIIPLLETEPDQLCLCEEIPNKSEGFIPPRLFNVLLVEDRENNAYLAIIRLKQIRHEVEWAKNGLEALEAYQNGGHDLILMDVMMPDLDGHEVCRRLKADPLTHDIPVIFVTAMGDVDDEAAGFDVGAVDYIHKPVSPAIMIRRVRTHLSLVHVKELEDSQREAIYMLGAAGHYNDNDTGLHIWRMAAYARAIAEATGWPEHMTERLELAAPLHDTGKIGILDGILKAPRKLTAEE